MGKRGPVPKRSELRQRRNKDEVETKSAPATPVIESPPADPEWHSIAVEWFESLGKSGQAFFYEESDWATARYIAEAMSRNLKQGRFSAQLFAAVMSGMTELLTTEGARRRARVELQKGDEAPDLTLVADLDEFRKSLEG
jgi:hypothetical protein